MGIIQNKKNNMYDVSYHRRHPITKIPITIKRTGFKSRQKAEMALVEIAKELERKFQQVLIPTWRELAEKNIKRLFDKSRSKKTAENAMYDLRAHTYDLLGEKLITEIKGSEIEYIVKKKLADRSASQQKNVLKHIRGVFRYAIEERIIMSDPVPVMHFREGCKIKKVLTEEQISILLNKARIYNNEWYPIWAMAIYTGMRTSELRGLTWDKIDLDKRLILVDGSLDSEDKFKSTKTEDDRIAEIAPPLLTILKELKLRSGGEGFVLPRLPKWKRGDQARELRKFLMGIGMEGVRFHDLRASWATVMLCKGIEPIKVMSMGGWKDLKTMQIYVRKSGINISGITNKLDFQENKAGNVIALERR